MFFLEKKRKPNCQKFQAVNYQEIVTTGRLHYLQHKIKSENILDNFLTS